MTVALSRILPQAPPTRPSSTPPTSGWRRTPSPPPPSLHLASVLLECPPNPVGSAPDSTTSFLRVKNAFPSNFISPLLPPIGMPLPLFFRHALRPTSFAILPCQMTGGAFFAPPYPYGQSAKRRSLTTSSIRTRAKTSPTKLLFRAARPPTISTRKTRIKMG